MLQDIETYRRINRESDFRWLFGLVHHPEHYIRVRVASVAPIQLFLPSLGLDPDPAVRAAVVDNQTSPPEYAEAVANIEFKQPRKEMSAPVLQALAYKPGLSELTYRHLQDIGSWYILIGLVHNESCPRDILESIADLPEDIRGRNDAYGGYDKNLEIRAIARTRLGLAKFEAATAK